ncbi:hypothetical protein DBR32_06060 [Taibaiella sp. KBW10]|uniref:hypothetical protein n=1 Tax=Taibaiella sp. KBW10 TaxID=2153357 RepID=UPI000F593B89|nr:hypothetical protein [Taibaiella sp. KBW10]RQO31519.1 hypothetical protein DBR32_06060 [Taibaiella sp. KBW10]
MKLKILLFVFVLSWAPGLLHAQKGTTAIALNDYYVSITDSMYNYGVKWGEKFNVIYQGSKDFTALGAERKVLHQFIVRKQKELLLHKDAYGSEDLRLAVLNFLFYEKKMLEEGFIPVEKLTKSSTEAEINKVIGNLTVLAEEESVEIKKVNEAQEAFAKKNGFAIEAAAE